MHRFLLISNRFNPLYNYNFFSIKSANIPTARICTDEIIIIVDTTPNPPPNTNLIPSMMRPIKNIMPERGRKILSGLKNITVLIINMKKVKVS